MAGGIDWFRWHHGSVTDQKFPLVARRANASVAEVIAVWACLLEAASMSSRRGNAGVPDFEAMDCALGMEEGKALRIYAAMQARDLVDLDGNLLAWTRRQPKREREEDPEAVAERQRLKRERDMAGECDVTPHHATSRPVTPRGEESREEEIQPPTVVVGKPAAPRHAACPTEVIVALYHEHCPMLSRIEVVNDARRRAISARWKEVITDPEIRKALDPREAALEWFAWFFGHVAQSRFLTGKAKDWRADFDFLMTPTKFARIVEGTYHKETA